jgi:hypothetical protein
MSVPFDFLAFALENARREFGWPVPCTSHPPDRRVGGLLNPYECSHCQTASRLSANSREYRNDGLTSVEKPAHFRVKR